ncbi:MAG: FHA domain-containing protein [Anaerolineales bacterium]|nr:FHA domain-containing protein [Anaerolineales bacterium]
MNPQAKLTLTDNYGQVYPVTTLSAQIGSASQCAIVLDEPGVSDVHAEIRFQDNNWTIQNMSEENSPSINGEKIQSVQNLTNGDVISIGGAILRVAIPEIQPVVNQFQQQDVGLQTPVADLSGFRSTGGAYISDTQPNQAIPKKSCRACHQPIHPEAEICPHCGVRQTLPPAPAPIVGNKSRTTAGLLAIFLGAFGIHKFYLGQGLAGLIYLVFFWTYIPGIIGFIEGISYFMMSDQQFAQKYG